MRLKYEHGLFVFPNHTNDRGTIFGGEFMSTIDLAVAQHVMFLLYEGKSECQDAVLVHFTVDFHDKAIVGDLLTTTSTVDRIGLKSLSFTTESRRLDGKLMATAKVTYISRKDGEPHKHGLPMYSKREADANGGSN